MKNHFFENAGKKPRVFEAKIWFPLAKIFINMEIKDCKLIEPCRRLSIELQIKKRGDNYEH